MFREKSVQSEIHAAAERIARDFHLLAIVRETRSRSRLLHWYNLWRFTRIFQASVPRISTCVRKHDIATASVGSQSYQATSRMNFTEKLENRTLIVRKKREKRKRGKITLNLKYEQSHLPFPCSINVLKLAWKTIDWSLSAECKRKLSKFVCIALRGCLKIIRRIENPPRSKNRKRAKRTKAER